MAIILAPQYREVVAALVKEPEVIAMAEGLARVPREQIVNEEGEPVWEFVLAACRELDKRGVGRELPLHIGAAAEALIILLKEKGQL